MNWVYVVAIVAFLVGFGMALQALKVLRSQAHAQAEIQWKQDPLSPWRYETLSMVGIILHSLGELALTACMILSLHQLFPVSFPQGPSVIFYLLSLGAVLLTSYISGTMLSFHLVQPWVRPVSYGISNEGMWYGGTRIDWKSYSYYELGPESGMISYHSSYCPPLRTWVLQPPAEVFSSVLAIVQRNVPSIAPLSDSIPFRRSPVFLILTMTALVLVAVAPAVWGLSQGQPWVWMYAFLAFFVLQSLGLRLITVFDGRGHTLHETENQP